MSDRIDCEHVSRLLADFAAENLRKGEAGRVREHLAACEGCRREMQAYEAVATLVEDHGLLEPPAGLWNGVLNRITDPDRERSAVRRQRRLGLRLRLGAAVLAALAVIGWFGLSSLKQPRTPTSVANAVAAEYLEGHAVGSRDALFADRFNLASIAALAEAEQQKNRRL